MLASGPEEARGRCEPVLGDLELPLVHATLQQFDRALELGHGDEDMSAVYYASAERAGARS